METPITQQTYSINGSYTIQRTSTPTRLQILLWAAGLVAGLGLILYNLPKFQVGAHYDDAAYITLARSFLNSPNFGLINFPGEPLLANYPFGFPLALSLIAAFSPNELMAYKVVSVLATLLNASLLFWFWPLFSRRLSNWWGLAISMLYLFSPVTIDLSGRVMSEPLFLTLYLSAMLLAGFGCRAQFKSKSAVWLWPIGLGSLLALIPFVRTIGITITASIFIYVLVVKRKQLFKTLFLILSGMVLIIALIVVATPVNWHDLLPTKYLSDKQAAFLIGLTGPLLADPETQPVSASETQAEELATQRGLTGLVQDYLIEGPKQHFGRSLRSAVFPFAGTSGEEEFTARIGLPFLPVVIGYLFSAITIYGYFRWVKIDGMSVFILTSVVYFVALFAWVWNEPRFLNPIAPQLQTAFLLGIAGILIFATKGIRLATHKDISWLIGPALVAATSLILVLSFYKSVTISDSRVHIGLLADRTAWLRQNASQDAIVMSEYPVIDYLYSDRLTTAIPLRSLNLEEISALIIQKDVDFILLAPQISWMRPTFVPHYSDRITELLPLIHVLAEKNMLQVVFQDDDAKINIYQVVRKTQQ